MILGYAEILKRVREDKLLESCEGGNIGGAGVDLRLKAVYRPKSEAKLGKLERKTPDIEEVEEDCITVKPGEYLLVETVEKVNMPNDLLARILPRSSLYRCGGGLRHAVVDPGYKGTLTFGLKNEGFFDLHLERGARICQIVFEQVFGETKTYGGKYQGGKVV